MAERQVFVAREKELGKLNQFLERALGNQGTVCFVTGEAGSGKTSLTNEFTQRTQEKYENLIVAVGSGDTQTGANDPYLPFREVLRQLTGDVEVDLTRGVISKENASRLQKLIRFSGQALVDVGPDLVGLFLPGAGFIARVGAFLAEQSGLFKSLKKLTKLPTETPVGGGIQQDHIFDQYTNILLALAKQQPIILVLDDLQWFDAASMGLLFRLGRRITQSQILIIGTFRPAEIAIGRAGERHPLEKVIAEFKRYYGDITVDLSQIEEDERQRFVNVFIDTEPNQLGDDFKKSLYEHTRGNPLFTIELLRNLQERGDLQIDAKGRWIEGSILNWDRMPARVEGVLEERIGRLQESLRESLSIASLEGLDFTAEVVARVQRVDERGLILQLSGTLDKQHRLVSARGVLRLRDQRLSLYRFQHLLFQKYLYNNMDQVQRPYLHEQVGRVLEALYGDQADEIAVQLAWHFVEAGVSEKARSYLQIAGMQAAARYANQEAADFLTQAIELTPDTDIPGCVALLFDREKVYNLMGERGLQQQDLDDLDVLIGTLDEGEVDTLSQLAELEIRKGFFAEATGEFHESILAAQKIIQYAIAGGDNHRQAMGLRLWGTALLHKGEYEEARNHLDESLQISRELGERTGEYNSLNELGNIAKLVSNYGKAKEYFESALNIARDMGDQLGISKMLYNLGSVANVLGDNQEAVSYYEEALEINRQIGFRRGEGVGLNHIGVLYARQGIFDKARQHMEKALVIFQEIDDREGEAASLSFIGVVAGMQSDFKRSKEYLEHALSIHRELGDRYGECNSLLNLGNIVFDQGDFREAKKYYEQSLVIIRELDNKRHEAHALISLGEILISLGSYDIARSHFENALKIHTEIGDKRGEVTTIGELGLIAEILGDYINAEEKFEQCLNLAREIGHRLWEGRCLHLISLLNHHQGRNEIALDYGQQALDIGVELDNGSLQGNAHAIMGHTHLALGNLEDAEAAFMAAIDLWRKANQSHLAVEGTAGLAQVYMVQGNLHKALEQVEKIMMVLEAGSPDFTIEPFRIYLTCFQILEEVQDIRAKEVLKDAVERLNERARKIGNETLRHSYLNNVPVNRELLAYANKGKPTYGNNNREPNLDQNWK